MTTKPYCLEELTREEIDRLLQEGMQSIISGNTYTAEEVDKILAERFDTSYQSSDKFKNGS